MVGAQGVDHPVRFARLEDRVTEGDVGLVGDLDEDIPVSRVCEEGDAVARRAPDRFLVCEPLDVPPVEESRDDHHSQLVGGRENSANAVGVGRFQLALGGERAVVVVS